MREMFYMNELQGLHHVSALTSSAEKSYDFFTHILGMRLVKKTVNQDDIRTYHLFFADDEGSAGTEMTFFDFPGLPKGVHGTNEIYKTSFRVPTDKALTYWVKRFEHYEVDYDDVEDVFGKKTLSFRDEDDQQYMLISDENNEGVASGIPWKKGPVPLEYAITGLGPIHIRVAKYDRLQKKLEEAMLLRHIATDGKFHLFEMGEGGNGAQVIIEHNEKLPRGKQGYGAVHHVAFRVKDSAALHEWIERMHATKLPASAHIDRFYFESLYVRVAPGVLFEWATDGPGFMIDEPYETLGEELALPPFLQAKREQVERLIRPIDTVRSTKHFEKEYFNL